MKRVQWLLKLKQQNVTNCIVDRCKTVIMGKYNLFNLNKFYGKDQFNILVIKLIDLINFHENISME